MSSWIKKFFNFKTQSPPKPIDIPNMEKIYEKPTETDEKIQILQKKGYKFGKKSENCLSTCHPDIQKVLREAINHINFSVIEGYRTRKKQNEYFDSGTSGVQYPNSYHNTTLEHIKDEHSKEALHMEKVCSLAVDVIPYPFKAPEYWTDTRKFDELAVVIKRIAEEMDIPLEWGFDLWRFDKPHMQLSSYRILRYNGYNTR
jgi:peptidoglycan L-alanyl-D-glutamate endopeptidase CwlK